MPAGWRGVWAYCAATSRPHTGPGRHVDGPDREPASDRPNGRTVDQERYDAAGLVLWLVAALNLFNGVLLLVVRGTGGEAFGVTLGVVLVATALVLAGLGLAVRRRSRTAVIAAVILLGLILALRAAPLLAGDVGIGNVLSVVVTAFLLYVVARPLAR